MTNLTVTIPGVPAGVLLPNRRRKAHWATINVATQQLRADAGWAIKAAMPHDWQPITGPFALTLHIAWPSNRRAPDLDAAANSAKAAIDALADSAVIKDDNQMAELHVTQSKAGDKIGSITMTIRAMSQEEAA